MSPYESDRKMADDFHLILNDDRKQDEATTLRRLEEAKVGEAKRKHMVQIQKNKSWCNRKIEELKVCLDTIETASNYLQDKQPEAYETIVQIGSKDDTGVVDEDGNLTDAAALAKEILDDDARHFQERNPNLYLFNAYYTWMRLHHIYVLIIFQLRMDTRRD